MKINQLYGESSEKSFPLYIIYFYYGQEGYIGVGYLVIILKLVKSILGIAAHRVLRS